MPRSHLLAAIAIGLAGLAGCGDDAATREPITIGLLLPVTGDLAAFGKEFSDAALLVIEDVNQHGGVLDGRELQLTVRDTGTSPTGAMVGYDALVNERVTAMLGPAASSEAVALQSQLRAGSALAISPSASSAALSALDFGGNFYRLAASDTVQSKVLAQLIDEAHLTNLCMVIRDDAYGTGIASAVQAELATLAAPPTTIKVATYEPTATNLSMTLSPCGMPDRTTGAKNGILFVTLIADGATLMDYAQASYGWSPAMGDQVFLTDGTRDADLLSLLDDPGFVEGARGTASTGPDAASPDGAELAAFRTAFQDRFGRASDVYAEMAYDATYAVAMAIELAGDDDVTAYREALGKLSSGTQVSAGNWAALKAELDAHGELDFRGASGAMTLAPPSVDLAGPYFIEVWSIVGGAPTQLEVRKVQ